MKIRVAAVFGSKVIAGACHLFVQLEYQPNEVALEVRDDGRGFAADQKPESASGQYGLTGMKERAATIGANLEISSEPGTGTTIRLRATTPRETQSSQGEREKTKEQP